MLFFLGKNQQRTFTHRFQNSSLMAFLYCHNLPKYEMMLIDYPHPIYLLECSQTFPLHIQSSSLEHHFADIPLSKSPTYKCHVLLFLAAFNT